MEARPSCSSPWATALLPPPGPRGSAAGAWVRAIASRRAAPHAPSTCPLTSITSSLEIRASSRSMAAGARCLSAAGVERAWVSCRGPVMVSRSGGSRLGRPAVTERPAHDAGLLNPSGAPRRTRRRSRRSACGASPAPARADRARRALRRRPRGRGAAPGCGAASACRSRPTMPRRAG